MGRSYDRIDERIAAFVLAQPVFFVATAPLDANGSVNCSPKSNNREFAVLDEHRVAYLARTGCGAETIAHLRENGRIVVMFCAFEDPPRIVRFHGSGEVVRRGDDRFGELEEHFSPPNTAGARAVIVVTADRVSDSCGYGVPLMAFESHRTLLDDWAERKGPAGVRSYWAENNATSLDGLPAIDPVS